MSQYGREYRMEWVTAATQAVASQHIRASIFQTSYLIADDETPEVISLTPTSNPLNIEVVNNERDKFSPVWAKQATLRFVSKSNLNQDISTFCDWPDNEWYVRIYDVDSTLTIFVGYLMLSDMQQLLQPDPNVVELVVSDHLASLRDKPLVDDDGNNPTGKYKIAQILAMCLKQTGLSLEMQVVNNLRHGGGQLTSTTAVTFSASAGYFVLGASMSSFFYPGQQITISGTASNNGTFTVIAVGVLVTTFVYVSQAIIDEVAGIGVVFQDASSQGHLYDKVYLDAKTFESEIGECVDCHTALSMVLSFDCHLTQWQGSWWIVRTDEYDGYNMYKATFDADGNYDSIILISILKSIGRSEFVKFANADNIMQPDRPYKYVRLTYNYQSPIEILCNIDFSRGDYVDDVNDTEKRYEIDCWTLKHGLPGSTDTNYDGVTAYIHRKFNQNDNETERYIVMTPKGTFETSSFDSVYIQSQPVYMSAEDKFVASIQWRLPSAIATGGHNQRLFRFVLEGDDGSWWILGRPSDTGGTDNTLIWYDTTGWTVNTGRGVTSIDYDIVEEDQWQTISLEAPPLPVSGNVYCWINQYNQHNDADDDTEVWYTSLQFEYVPLINGSYRRTDGHYNQVTRATEPEKYNAKLEEEVYIGDSPKKLFKGAMFILTGGVYYLTSVFYSSARFNLGNPTDNSFLHQYGWFQIQAVWNQYRNNTRYFDGSLLGLGSDWPDLCHKYLLTDTNPNTNNRYFMLISFNQGWKSQVCSGVIAEVYRSDTGRVYTDTYLFKFLFR